MTRRSDPHSWTSVRLPEGDLGETILEFASPLLEKLGDGATIEQERRALTLAVSFWNASVNASKLWVRPRIKELNELKKRFCGRDSSREDSAVFELLTERRRDHWHDPRLVEQWSYERVESDARLSCTVGLPDGVRAEVPPPTKKRINHRWRVSRRSQDSSGGWRVLVLEVPVRTSPCRRDRRWHRAVYTMMPVALQLFAEGRLSRVGGPAVEVAIGGRALGALVLTEVRCAGQRQDVAELAFKPAVTDSSRRLDERVTLLNLSRRLNRDWHRADARLAFGAPGLQLAACQLRRSRMRERAALQDLERQLSHSWLFQASSRVCASSMFVFSMLI